jgi:transposase
MYRDKKPRQEMVFIPGSLSDYVPEDHILRRVDAVLDLGFLKNEVKGLYSSWTGRPCIGPETAVRLMLAGFLHGIVQDRKLIREAQVNLAYLWFIGYELGEELPDHSSLTKIRQRWGEEKFRRIFIKTVEQCAKSGLIGGEMSHVDASLIRADVSWESLVKVHVDKVLAENEDESDEGDEPPPPAREKARQKSKVKVKKVSRTDPEASMATSCKKVRLEPTYKQHTSVDDMVGVIVDVHVTTGEASEGVEFAEQIKRISENTGKTPKRVTADRGYSSSKNYALLESLEIEAIIPTTKEVVRAGRIPLRRFKYDAKAGVVRCPMGKRLTRGSRGKNGYWYRAQACDCSECPFMAKCVPAKSKSRSVLILDGYVALLRARREKERGWKPEKVEAYKRHRYQVEGVHGESKSEHGLRRAVGRGLANIRIQAYLTAMVINLKRLVDHSKSAGAPLETGQYAALLGFCATFIGHIRDSLIIRPSKWRICLSR